MVPFLVFLAAFCGVSSAKETSLQFYMHDNVLPPNQTALMVAGTGGFGTVTVIDDVITDGPKQTSARIGRGQGTWIVSQINGQSLLLTFSVVFQSGEYSGSTISLHGADILSQTVREIAVIGGTGVFRKAQGYALIKTVQFTPSSVSLEINITVIH